MKTITYIASSLFCQQSWVYASIESVTNAMRLEEERESRRGLQESVDLHCLHYRRGCKTWEWMGLGEGEGSFEAAHFKGPGGLRFQSKYIEKERSYNA